LARFLGNASAQKSPGRSGLKHSLEIQISMRGSEGMSPRMSLRSSGLAALGNSSISKALIQFNRFL